MAEHPQNYTLGRGELFFAAFMSGTQTPGGERYIGNTPEFNVTIEEENLDHFSSDRGINEKDASISLQTDRTGSFMTDNIDPENMALFFFGSAERLTVAGGAVSGEAVPAAQKGLYYQLGMTPQNPAGARNISLVTVNDTTQPTPTTFIVNDDYEIDLDLGRLYIVPAGSIGDGTDLVVDYTQAPHERDKVISGSTPIEGAMRFVSYHAAGKQFDWYMPYVKLTPNGDHALKGDEWQQLPFNVEILKKSGMAAIYVDGRPL